MLSGFSTSPAVEDPSFHPFSHHPTALPEVTLQLKRSGGHCREVPGAPFPIHLLLSNHEP